MQQAVLDLVDAPPALVGQVLQAAPHQQRARDVVAPDARSPALATFDPRQLLGLSVKLLDLPAHPARLSRVSHRIPSRIVRDDPLRAARMHHYPEEPHLVLFGEPLDLRASPGGLWG